MFTYIYIYIVYIHLDFIGFPSRRRPTMIGSSSPLGAAPASTSGRQTIRGRRRSAAVGTRSNGPAGPTGLFLSFEKCLWLFLAGWVRYTISCHIILYHSISYHTIRYQTMASHIVSHHGISYHVSYHISYRIQSYHIISNRTISYHIISYHIKSYHIIS